MAAPHSGRYNPMWLVLMSLLGVFGKDSMACGCCTSATSLEGTFAHPKGSQKGSCSSTAEPIHVPKTLYILNNLSTMMHAQNSLRTSHGLAFLFLA